MKKIKSLKVSAILLVSVLLFGACSSDDDIVNIPSNGTFSLTFQKLETSLKDVNVTDSSATQEEVSAVFISIKNSAGDYEYNMEKLTLIDFNGVYITGNIELEEGDYTVEDFVVVNSDNSVVYLTPKSGSEFASLVDYPLPVTFTVSANDTSFVTLQVISATLGESEQYGYVQFSFEVVEAPDFSVLDSGLIAYYPFDGNTNDYSGNNYNGTEYYSSDYVEGVIGQAKNFDGINDFVQLENFPSISNGLTFSFWINSRGTTGNSYNGAVICQYNPSNKRSFAINSFRSYEENKVNTLNCSFYRYGSTREYRDEVTSNLISLDSLPDGVDHDLYTIVNPIEITLDQWTSCVVNVTNSEIQLWINGELTVKKQREYSTYFFSSYEPTYFGNNFGGAIDDYHLNGLLDELRVYDRGLSEEEIKLLYIHR